MKRLIGSILFVLACLVPEIGTSQCGPLTPAFTVNLVGQPNGTYTSPSITRNDLCCGATAPDVCLKFTIFLDPNAIGINFQIISGAVPPGALFYQINCGPLIPVGSPICLNGPGPHILTFCKPGNNDNIYAITSIPGPVVPDSVTVRSGCTATLGVTGFSVPTIVWNSINPGPPGTYNNYLSCVTGCATVAVTPAGVPPPFVDYLVTGSVQAPCQANTYQDTVRVYFYNDLIASINPTLTTLCFGQTNALLTGTVTGGLPPYTYSWSNGATGNTVSVGPGTYTLFVGDNTTCPPTTATAVVNSFSMPISVNAGSDQVLCKTNPVASLNGTVLMAGGGLWGGGTGTFSPSQTALSITYAPTPLEINTGSVQLSFTTTGNSGCPGAIDFVNLYFQDPPIANAGPHATVCANNSNVILSGSITAYTATPVWSGSGTGIFTNPASLTTTYIPSQQDIIAGSVTLNLTTANNGVCPAATSTMIVFITPAPTVVAGPSQSVCSTNTVFLSGNVSGPTSTGAWSSNGDGTFLPSPNSPVTAYLPGANDINSGNVTLTLTSTGNGNCLAVSNTLTVYIRKPAIAAAGPSQQVCSTTSTISLTGAVSGGTNTGIWTVNGSGVFNPSPNNLNNTYFISIADLSMGVLIFTLTSTNNGPCPASSDTAMLMISQLASVNAGLNQHICQDKDSLQLNGIVNTGNGMWLSTGSGIFQPDNLNLSPYYHLTQSDINSGSVTFTLASTNNGPCPVVRDTVKITIRKLAVVNAGSDIQICSTTSAVSVSGSITVGSNSGIWSTMGGGNFSPSNINLNTSYNLSGSDFSSGTVSLILASQNNGVCPVVRDTLKIKVFKMPVINLSSDTALCEYQNPLKLSPGVAGDIGLLEWSTNGTGTFVPHKHANPITYDFSPDVNVGLVKLTITALNNGPCANVSGSISVRIYKAPVADFSPSTYTANIPNDPIIFTNLSKHSNSYFWDFGDGGFSGAVNPSHNYLNAGYYTVSMVATNEFGCKDTARKDIVVVSDIQFPNVFTPNLAGANGGAYNVNDYSNNVFFPYTSGVTDYNLKIFNRWGELIFESNDLTIGWDGYFNGKLCQQDAYVWKADVKFFNGRTYNKTGSVTLLR